MGALFNILHYSMGSLFWGVFIGVACLALFFLLIKGWYKDAHFNIATYITGAVLGCLLMFQCILICGSISIIRLARSYEPTVTAFVETITTAPGQYITAEESHAVVSDMISHSPLLAHYIGGGEFTGYTAAELPRAITNELESYMRYYILRRILWSLGFVITGAVIVSKTMDRQRPVRRRVAVASGGYAPSGERRRRPGRDNRRIARRR